MKELAEKYRNEFKIIKNGLYLDHAAMSPLPKRVWDGINMFHENRACYGSDFKQYWEKVNEVREQIARKINAEEQEIVFLLNTSMGINLAANAIPFKENDNVIITDLEFPSNVYPWMNLKSKGVNIKFVQNKDGDFTVEQFEEMIDGHTRVISVSWVIAGNGAVLDIERIGNLCRKKGIYFVIDAIQGLGVLPLDVKRIKPDFVVSGFFKWLFGPDGIAFTYINKEILSKINNPYVGWAGMKEPFNYTEYKFELVEGARRFETGNMNFSAFYGLNEALDMTEGIEKEVFQNVIKLTKYLRKELALIPNVKILSPNTNDLVAGITLFTSKDDKKVLDKFREKNIRVNYRDGIRVSPHFYNTKQEIDVFLYTLENILKE